MRIDTYTDIRKIIICTNNSSTWQWWKLLCDDDVGKNINIISQSQTYSDEECGL